MTRTTSEWRRVRAKHVYRVVDQRRGPEDLPLLAVSIHKGVVPRETMTDDEARADDLSSYKRCATHDIVVNRMRAFQGAIGIAPQVGIVSPDYLVLRVVEGEPRFFHHLFRSTWFVGEMTSRLRGIGGSDQGNVRTPRINAEELGEIRISLPSLPEQRAVADYLDAETARIDTLIERKLRMIELINHRRRAVIDGLTVPRALGGSADSNGEQAWPVTALKRAADFFSDGDWIESPHITSGGIRLIQTGNIGEGEYQEKGFRFISEATFAELDCTEVHPGDVLVSRLAGPVGCACLAPDLGVRMISSVDVAIIRTTAGVDPSFVVAYLSSSRHLAYAELLARGTTMQRLSRSQVGDMRLPLPDLDVQRRVAEQVVVSTHRLNETNDALRQQIDLLREHREALITAVVTGQLDVAKAAA